MYFSHYECCGLPLNQTGFITVLNKVCNMCSMLDLPQCQKQSFVHGYGFLKICWDVWNVLSYSLHYIIKCWRRHSAVLRNLVESFLSSLQRWWNSPNWYRLLNMSCLLRLSTQLKSDWWMTFYKSQRWNSYVRSWICIRVAELPWPGSHGQLSGWNSEAKRPPLKNLRYPSLSLRRTLPDGSKFTDGLWLILLGSGCWRIFVGTSSEQQELDQELWGCLLAVRRFRRIRRYPFFARFQCWSCASHLQGSLHRHLYCWTLEVMIQMTRLQFKRKFFLLRLSFVCHISQVLYIFCKFKYIFSLFENILPGATFPILTMRLWKSLSSYVVSNNFAGLGTTYDVTSGHDCELF
jgi:hypothetical protein